MPPSHEPASYRQGGLRVIAVAATTCMFDQWLKLWVAFYSGLPFNQYPPFGGREVVPGFFNLVCVTNRGAAWGMFSDYGFWLGLLSVAALAVIFSFRRHLELDRPAMQAAFGLICGGILGNLLDRVQYGHVIDFLDFQFGSYRYPTFNLADSAIFIGVALYIIRHLKESPAPPAPKP